MDSPRDGHFNSCFQTWRKRLLTSHVAESLHLKYRASDCTHVGHEHMCSQNVMDTIFQIVVELNAFALNQNYWKTT